jgi:hypothetical protein
MVKLLTPNPNPKCITHLPYSPKLMPPPTTTCPALHSIWTRTKPSYPKAHKSTAGSKNLPSNKTSNKHYGSYAKMTICFLTTASPTPRTNAPHSARMIPKIQSMWQSILLMHNATNQPSGLPNVAEIRPTAWVPRSI